MAARLTDWDGSERRGRPRLNLAPPIVGDCSELARLDVWLELERAAWVELRVALLEAMLPLAIVARDTYGACLTVALTEADLARQQASDPATNYGAF